MGQGSASSSTKTTNAKIEAIQVKPLTKDEMKEYESILDELSKLEHLVKGLDVMIEQSATDFQKAQELMAEREEAQGQVDAMTERWLDLEERLGL